MKKLILQVFIKLEKPIEGMKRFKPVDDLYDISIIQAKKFAEKWDADYLLVEDSSYLPDYAPTYQRFKMFDMTEYDQILYLDCDAVILDSCPNVFEEFKDHEFSAVRNYNWNDSKNDRHRIEYNKALGVPEEYRAFCAGVFVCNRQFLEKNKDNWRQYLPLYKSAAQYDQGILNRLIVDAGGVYNELDSDWGQWNKEGKYIDHLGGPFRKADFNKEKYVRKMSLTDFYINDSVKSLFDGL